MPEWANNRKKKRSLGNNNDGNIPLLQVTQSNTVETVRANRRYTAEDDQSTGASERKVSFVFHVFEPTSWWHIPVESQSTTSYHRRRGGMTTQNTHCLYGRADTACQRETRVSKSGIDTTGARPAV